MIRTGKFRSADRQMHSFLEGPDLPRPFPTKRLGFFIRTSIMKHEFPHINGRIARARLIRDPLDMEAPIERGSYRSTTLWWAGVFIAGVLFWIAVFRGVLWAFSV